MSRINTNVTSLVAQNILGRSNKSLEQALSRLSTGLRINTGKDDPAGLIASENLRSDITSIQRAIGNTDRANQVIATADSALGQVSSLLNDIRGLVTESANTGALSDEQIAANQLQIDSSLTALNRIAQTTEFQGRRLLDGSLDFLTTAGSNFAQLSDLSIDQANLGTSGTQPVAIAVTTAATNAQVDVTIPAATAAANATDTFTISNLATQAAGSLTVTAQATGTITVAGQTFNLRALEGGDAAGAEGNEIATLAITYGAGGASADYDETTNTLNVSVTQTDGGGTPADIDDIIAAINLSDDFVATIGGAVGGTTVSSVQAAAATFALTGGGSNALNLSAEIGGPADGAEGNEVSDLVIAFSQGVAGTTYNATNNTLTVNVTQNVGEATLANIVSAINAGTDFNATIGSATGTAVVGAAADDSAAFALVGGRDAGSADITVTADTAGSAANNVTVTFDEDSVANPNVNTAAAEIDGVNIVVHINGTVTKAAIAAAINNLTGYSASADVTGDTNYISANDDATSVTGTLGLGADAAGGIAQDVTLQIGGANGVEIFTFESGTGISALQSAIAAFSDSTGVTATVNGSTLELRSSAYGSDAFVDVKVLAQASGGTFTSSRQDGTDVVATVNGISALGKGNVVSLSTSSLSLSSTVAAGFTGTVNFTITGGGALFQLGPDVVTNQQARFGISSVNSSLLGGASGKLFELKSGESASLANDPTTAFRIVEEAINKITSLRGRLGSFQRTTLETNKAALGDTLVNLTDAESSIRDADFAAETAALTRAQILVQSGTTVLAIANQNPQNVLALLR